MKKSFAKKKKKKTSIKTWSQMPHGSTGEEFWSKYYFGIFARKFVDCYLVIQKIKNLAVIVFLLCSVSLVWNSALSTFEIVTVSKTNHTV